jgi:hypothetical protein
MAALTCTSASVLRVFLNGFFRQPPSEGAVARGSSGPPEAAGFAGEQRSSPALPLLVPGRRLSLTVETFPFAQRGSD